MVTTRSRTSTAPYSKGQEEKTATILIEKKERMEKEFIKQAKMLALLEEQAAKKKQMEEELERWKEQEENLAAVEAEVEEDEEIAEDKETEEEEALTRRRGEASSSRAPPEEEERAAKEWVAHLLLGEEREVELMIPQAERAAVTKELEGEVDPLRRQEKEQEKQLGWKLTLAQERIRRLEVAKKMERRIKAVETRMGKIGEETELGQKLHTLTHSVNSLLTAQQEQQKHIRGHDIALETV
ncbi:hypothetical protein CBR_g41432 [Chara braunii]|uniref:Uncharacterized protein n=1 Tax=Chara braunii TaxID=69332 RepID=A0A388LVZ6_CHABU|nr:hypothetical protein CBR_g41432 [Chara braunii]|eukprot:GBG86435.1 hypothetical protein CBR_g41432 [Chara braunii]